MKYLPRTSRIFKTGLTVAVASLLAGLTAHALPTITSLGAEENIGSRGGRLPSVAVDSRQQPHVVLDVQSSNRAIFWDKIDGVWRSQVVSIPGTTQFYNPHIEINDDDQAWISGVLWHPGGMGFFVRNNMSANPEFVSYYSRNYNGWLPISNISLHPEWSNLTGVNWTRGHYSNLRFNPGPNTVTDESYGYAGQLLGGEKSYFWVSKVPLEENRTPVYHFCTDAYYSNTEQYKRDAKRLDWARYASYPDMGNDGAYPMLVSDNIEPETAYIANSFQYGVRADRQGIYANIYTRDRGFLRGSHELLRIDAFGSSGMRRYQPQLYPANRGGAWISYTRNGWIFMSYIYVTENRQAAFTTPQGVVPGTRASFCVDIEGNIHLVYDNGGFKYRKIMVSGDDGRRDDGMAMFTPAFTLGHPAITVQNHNGDPLETGDTYDFGAVPSETHVTNRFEIVSSGRRHLRITGGAFTGNGSTPYSVPDLLPAVVPVRQTQSFHLVFNPTSTNVYTTTLVISNNASPAVFEINLTGQGEDAPN